MAVPDPYAIRLDLADHDPDFRLPALSKWDLGLFGFQIWDRQHGARRLRGYAGFWTDHMGGPEAVAHYVRASFDGTPTQDRKLALFAGTLTAFPHDDLLATYPLAFSCAAKANKLVAEMAMGTRHPADSIFETGREDDLARGLASVVKAHLASSDQTPVPKDLRWTLLMLLQGYARHGLRPRGFALYALAGVLGILDVHGRGAANLRLAGVTERRALVERAASFAFRAAGDEFEFDPKRIPDERADRVFEDSPIFWLAVNDNLRRLGAEPVTPDDDDES